MNSQKLFFRSVCPVSCWLDLFGDKWMLIVLRDVLVYRKRHYKEFAASAEGISTNILADRLGKLVDRGLLTKKLGDGNRQLIHYEPTELAASLLPVMVEITRWSNAHLPGTTPLSELLEAANDNQS